MRKIIAVALVLLAATAEAAPLSGIHVVAPPIVCNGVQTVIVFHPSPGNTIYVRKWSIYTYGAPNVSNTVSFGYVAIQKYSATPTNQIGIAVAFLAANPNPVAEKNFEPNSLMIGPTDSILVEAYCAPGLNGFNPVYDVLWTTTP